MKCVCIPHMDQVKKVRVAGKPTQYIDGEEIYSLQIQKLAIVALQLTHRRSLASSAAATNYAKPPAPFTPSMSGVSSLNM